MGSMLAIRPRLVCCPRPYISVHVTGILLALDGSDVRQKPTDTARIGSFAGGRSAVRRPPTQRINAHAGRGPRPQSLTRDGARGVLVGHLDRGTVSGCAPPRAAPLSRCRPWDWIIGPFPVAACGPGAGPRAACRCLPSPVEAAPRSTSDPRPKHDVSITQLYEVARGISQGGRRGPVDTERCLPPQFVRPIRGRRPGTLSRRCDSTNYGDPGGGRADSSGRGGPASQTRYIQKVIAMP